MNRHPTKVNDDHSRWHHSLLSQMGQLVDRERVLRCENEQLRAQLVDMKQQEKKKYDALMVEYCQLTNTKQVTVKAEWNDADVKEEMCDGAELVHASNDIHIKREHLEEQSHNGQQMDNEDPSTNAPNVTVNFKTESMDCDLVVVAKEEIKEEDEDGLDDDRCFVKRELLSDDEEQRDIGDAHTNAHNVTVNIKTESCDCDFVVVKQEIKEEVKDGEETRIIDIAGLTEDNQSGDGYGSRSLENAPMDCVKREIKEEEVDGQMLDIKKEEVEVEGETNEVIVNEGCEATLSNLEPITLSQAQNGDMSNASTSSNEPSNENLTNLVDQEEGQVNNSTQRQFDETNDQSHGETQLNDINQAGHDESSCMENAPMHTTPPHLTRQSQTNMNKSARHDKRKLKVPHTHNELTNRDNQHVQDDEDDAGEGTSRSVKRPRQSRSITSSTEPKQIISEESIATEPTTNPIQSNRHLQCSHCLKSFVSISKLERHLRVHTGERPFQCDQCDKRFSQKDHLERHQRIHSGERPFACRHCAQSFAQQNTRNRHEQAIHLQVKPYRCKQCGHTATHRSRLIIHIRVVHFGLPQTIKEQRALNIVDDRDPNELVEKV